VEWLAAKTESTSGPILINIADHSDRNHFIFALRIAQYWG